MLKKCSVLMNFAIMLLSVSLVQADNNVKPYPYESHYVPFSEPVPHGLVGNPLDYCGQRIGIDVRNFNLPRGWEGRYRFACRYPVIDAVSTNPLYMKQWTEENAENLIESFREDGLGVITDALGILRGTLDYPTDNKLLDNDFISEFKQAFANTGLSSEYLNILEEFYAQYVIAWLLIQKSVMDLNDDEIDFFISNPGYYLAPDGERMVPLTDNIDSCFVFIERARRVKFEYIFLASSIMADAINSYTSKTKHYKPLDFFSDTSKTNEVFEVELVTGLFIFGSVNDDIHVHDASMLIDPGGNDLYTNNAGSAINSVAVLIDHSGSDLYSTPDRNYVQGFGFLGCGFLVDLGGKDEYEAGCFSQGAGIMGVGVLWDWNGDDVYDADTFVQGAGMFGLGMLLDEHGEDFYCAASLGQAGATALGLGILIDLEGDDRYHLWIDRTKNNLNQMAGYGQGGGVSFRQYPWIRKLTPYGGVGFLIDTSGNDRYRTGGWCDQGGSYIMSLGVLYDAEGNDHYTANTGQGSGIHITNAILIDKAGHDIYEGGFRSGGSGGDRSPSFLIDYGGNDVYKGGQACYGSAVKPFALSLFIDYDGDDTYIAKNPEGPITMNNWESFGGVWPESVPHLWPYGISMDLGGNDDYQVKRRANNSETSSFGHGIHLDCNWSKGDVIGKVDNPLQQYENLSLPRSMVNSPYAHLIPQLQNPDTFIRFQAVG